MNDTNRCNLAEGESKVAEGDPCDHPWTDEMRQHEPTDEAVKEAEAWFS